nr:Ig-like domain-containing protein [Acidobacteriota bacterium]
TQITLNVGGAAAERILLTATPLGSSGGSSTVSAKVEDASGNPLAGVSVQFSATRGSLSSASATTNDAGVATVTLASTVESAVTATVGSRTASVTVTPAARSGLTITAPATITASSTATFTVAVTSGANVSNVRINWGDGTANDLGAVSGSQSAQHTYGAGGSYTVTASATMTDGTTEPSVSTPISVAEFQVGISSTNANPPPNTATTFTATTTPNTTNVQEYRWTFRDEPAGTTQTRVTQGPTVSYAFPTSGTKTVIVTVVPVTGNSRSNQMTVVVSGG